VVCNSDKHSVIAATSLACHNDLLASNLDLARSL
jgi:hypothetical protein